jgi:hypothetical protein
MLKQAPVTLSIRIVWDWTFFGSLRILALKNSSSYLEEGMHFPQR